jgi:hypothetical protein
MTQIALDCADRIYPQIAQITRILSWRRSTAKSRRLYAFLAAARIGLRAPTSVHGFAVATGRANAQE